MRYYCPHCAYRCTDYRSYARHVFESHSSIPNFSFTCGIKGCIRRLRNYHTLQSHLARNHCGEDLNSVLYDSPSESILRSDTAAENDLRASELDDDLGLEQSQRVCTAQSEGVIAVNELQKSSALFLLTLKEKYKLTQTAIDFAVDRMKVTVDNIIDDLHQGVAKEVINVTSDLSDADKLRIYSVFHNAKNPFNGLETRYLQSKYFEENFAVVVSLFSS